MKYLPKIWGGLLLVAFLGNSISLKAQSQMKNRKIDFRFFDLKEATAKKNLDQPGFGNKKFWILKRRKPLSVSEMEGWRKNGIQITHFFSKDIFEVCGPSSATPGVFKDLGVDQMAIIHPDQKLDFELREVKTNISKSTKIKVQVIACKGLKSSVIKGNWKAIWGEIEECWPGDFGKWVLSCSPDQIDSLAHCGWTRWIEKADEELIPLNRVAAANGRVKAANSSGFGWHQGLNGEGVSVAVGDGGMVERHADLEKNQENWTASKLASFADHQDHVSGIIGGQGFLQSDKMGMAPGTRIANLQTSSVISTGEQLIQQEGISLTNNSYGQTLQCNRAGLYNATSAFMDEQVFTNQTLLHVVASGNQGGSQCNGYPVGFQTIAEGYPTSKNGLTVGSCLGKDEFAWFSSMGPVADGRLKPEIVADGNDVSSTVPQDQYASKGGTSMAAPVVTGTLALLTQRFKQLYNNQLPEAALLKAIVCNSAEDIGLQHVDFSSGFGRLNGRRARQLIENHSFISGTVQSHQNQTYNLTAPNGATGVKVMLSWTDPSGIPGHEKALVNNLDLKVRNASGQLFLPWVLSPSPGQANQPAFRGIDSLNNMEQVTLPVFGGESIQIEVLSGNVTTGGQKFWIVYQWDNPSIWLTSPVRNEDLKSAQTTTFYWDLDAVEPSQLFIQTSPDSIGPWTDFQVIANPKALSSDKILPDELVSKKWFRLRAETSFGPMFSNRVGCKIGKTIVPQFQVCNSTVRITWNPIPEATRYQIFRLNAEKGIWKEEGTTTEPQFVIGNLENGVRTAFSITPWFGNQEGIRSAAKVVTPTESANCNWPDLVVSGFDMPVFYRKGTGFDSDIPVPVRIVLKNIGNEIINRNQVQIRVKFSSGQIVQSIHSVVLASGESKVLALSCSLDVSQPGEFPVSVWLAGNTDSNSQNDTLSSVFRVVGNPAILLPWSFNGAEMDESGESRSFLGYPAVPGLDFSSVNDARVRSHSRHLPESFGSSSIVLDKARLDGKTASSEVVFTLNLAGNIVDNELFVDFDIFPFSNQTIGNGFWIRSNDQSPWIEVLSFPNSNFNSGELNQIRNLNLRSFLTSPILGSSFQFKFTFSGQKPCDILNGQGYAVDNLMLYIPSRDVVVRSLLSPQAGCAGPASQKVKIRLFNERETSATQIRIGYSYEAGSVFEQIIPSIGANDSLDVEFGEALPSGLVGKVALKVWSIADGDEYFKNDTLQSSSLFISPVISYFPYYQGFEETNGYWKSTGIKSSWEWGSPSKGLSVIDTAANGTRLWTTNLDGFYNSKEASFLQSPCFNVSALSGDIQLSFNSKFDTEPDYDNFWVEYSEDGQQWKKLGEKGLGTNWYNHDSQNWNGNQSRWQVVSYKLPKAFLTSYKSLQFRLAFQADLSNQGAGIAFDDFHMEQSVEIGNEFLESVSISRQTRGNQWTRIGSDGGRLAEIEIGNQQNPISFSAFGNEGKIRNFGFASYLDRNFKMESGLDNNRESKIRLFFTDSELLKLEQDISIFKSFQNLAVYQYRGLNMDRTPENNAFPIGKSRFIAADKILKVPTSGGYYVEFSAVPDGEFYLTTQSFDAGDLPLPVQMIHFSAKRRTNSKLVEINWKTASERNCEVFELQVSANGKDFQSIERFQPKGSDFQGSEYNFIHQPEVPNGMIWYRLNQFDFQNEKPNSYFTLVKDMAAPKTDISFVNPIGSFLQPIGSLPIQTRIIVTDALGKLVANENSGTGDFEISTSNWPSGMYFVKVVSEMGNWTQTLIKP